MYNPGEKPGYETSSKIPVQKYLKLDKVPSFRTIP